jgi:hypothetical protein
VVTEQVDDEELDDPDDDGHHKEGEGVLNVDSKDEENDDEDSGFEQMERYEGEEEEDLVDIDMKRESRDGIPSDRQRTGNSVPVSERSTASTVECPTTTEQTFELQRLQWRASLEPENN